MPSKAEKQVMANRKARFAHREERAKASTAKRGLRRASSDTRKKRSGGYGSIKYY